MKTITPPYINIADTFMDEATGEVEIRFVLNLDTITTQSLGTAINLRRDAVDTFVEGFTSALVEFVDEYAFG